jgi:hypothetical protein
MNNADRLTHAIRSLAISETGFVFDPRTGHSYSVNRTGLTVLRALKEGRARHEIADKLSRDFTRASAVEEDLAAFVKMLEELGISASAERK